MSWVNLNDIFVTRKEWDSVSQLQNDVSQLKNDTGWVYAWKSDTVDIRCRRIGKTVFVRGDMWNGAPVNKDWTAITVIPERFRPDHNIYFAGTTIDGYYPINIRIKYDTGALDAITAAGDNTAYWAFAASYPI